MFKASKKGQGGVYIVRITATGFLVSTMIALGAVSLAFSAYSSSSVLAFIGLCLTFWGILLLYIAPKKHVPLEMFTIAASSTLRNVEKLLADMNPCEKGIYLPPKYMHDLESSIVFVSCNEQASLPKTRQADKEEMHIKNPRGMFLTPPGHELSRFFEKQLGTSFLALDLDFLQEKLPDLLVDNLEIAEGAEINVDDSIVKVQLKNHIFHTLCEETRKLPNTHKALGCLLSSAIACALAKATRKPVTIEEETQDGETTRIQYRMLEE